MFDINFNECSIIIKSCYTLKDVGETINDIIKHIPSLNEVAIWYYYDNVKYLYIRLENDLDTYGLYCILRDMYGLDIGFRDFIDLDIFKDKKDILLNIENLIITEYKRKPMEEFRYLAENVTLD